MTGCDLLRRTCQVGPSRQSMAVETMDVDPEEQLSFLRMCCLDTLKEQLASFDLNAIPGH